MIFCFQEELRHIVDPVDPRRRLLRHLQRSRFVSFFNWKQRTNDSVLQYRRKPTALAWCGDRDVVTFAWRWLPLVVSYVKVCIQGLSPRPIILVIPPIESRFLLRSRLVVARFTTSKLKTKESSHLPKETLSISSPVWTRIGSKENWGASEDSFHLTTSTY